MDRRVKLIFLHIIFIPMTYCIISMALVVIFDITPKYIELPVQPIELSVDLYSKSKWENIQCINKEAAIIVGRYFICKGEIFVQYTDNIKFIDILPRLEKYYDTQLSILGWKQFNGSADCNYFISLFNKDKKIELKYKILKYREEEYIGINNNNEEDLICIGIENDETNLRYGVIMLTIRPSLIQKKFYGFL